MPIDIARTGGRFLAADRAEDSQLAAALGGGADLLVDCICYTAADARQLLPLLKDVGSTAMISSKAVYVDSAGNHVNSDEAPRFDGPIHETQPTVPAGSIAYDSREGYGPNKVAAEHVLLDSDRPVTVIRPSKVHGPGATNPREWFFVKRILDQRPAVFLARRGTSVDHTSAAANIAALIETVAAFPGPRILNSADPDAPSALQISRTIARHLGYEWDEILLADAGKDSPGDHPWNTAHPIVLDTAAATELGYTPVGDYAFTVSMAIDWLVAAARGDIADSIPATDDPFFRPLFNYDAENAFVESNIAQPRIN